MFKVTPKPAYTFKGRIPELQHYLLKCNTTGSLELWADSKGTSGRPAIKIQGHALEFVRDVVKAARVVDNEYNRAYCPDDIGRIYVDVYPNHAYVEEI